MFPVISCEWGEMITVMYDFSVIIHMNSSVSKLVNYFAVTQSVVSLRKWIFYSSVVVFIHLLFILFSLSFNKYLLSTYYVQAPLEAPRLHLSSWCRFSGRWRQKTNKRLKRNMSCGKKNRVES